MQRISETEHNIIIFNGFIEHLFDKYDDDNLVDLTLMNSKIPTIKGNVDAEFEMIRIKISCSIDELKDVFDSILPKTFDNEKFHVSMYLNNINKDCWRISKLFGDKSYWMIIEIYHHDYRPFERTKSGAGFPATDLIKIDLDDFYIL